jgi:hypothetical protein
LDQIEKIFFLCRAPDHHNWPNFDRLPGCEGVNKFNNHPRRLKTTYDRCVAVLWGTLFQALFIDESPVASGLRRWICWTSC